jgi:hypothetical protein
VTKAMALTLPVYAPPHLHCIPRDTGAIYELTINAQRGGVGNIGSPRVRPTSKVPHDSEMIPELAVRNSSDENYHVGVSNSLSLCLSLSRIIFPLGILSTLCTLGFWQYS